MRVMPHENTIIDSDYTEVLDYEKATSVVKSHNKLPLDYVPAGMKKCTLEKKDVLSLLIHALHLGKV